MKLHKNRSCFRKHLTAELAENAENVIIDNLCVLSDLCGERKIYLFRSDWTLAASGRAYMKHPFIIRHSSFVNFSGRIQPLLVSP